VTPAQQKRFEEQFAHFLYTTLTSFNRLNSPELASALATLGAIPATVHQARGALLDAAYDRAVQASIQNIVNSPSVRITMDGWKKRSCEHGAPLITGFIPLPCGTAQFWQVCPLYHDRLSMPSK
jgi:hypothetical protein